MTTAILCSRGRGCQTVTLPETPLIKRIEQMLRRANGKRFTVRGNMAQLGLEHGFEGEPWQNVCRVIEQLTKLETRETIRCAFPDRECPDFQHWIEPPREDAP